MTSQSNPIDTPDADGEARLRSSVEHLADQLCLAVDGQFDFAVKVDVADETVQKLQMLVNFVVDAARRSLSELQAKVVELEAAYGILSDTNLQLAEKVGEKYQKEQELRLREANLSAILSSTLDPMFSVDAFGQILSASNSVEPVFGWTPEELVGQNIKVLTPEPHRSSHDTYLANYRKTGKTNILNHPREFEAVRKDGSTFPCEISVSLVERPGEKLPLFTGIIRDITERKQKQQEIDTYTKGLEESRHELEQQTSELKRQREHLEEAQAHAKQNNHDLLAVIGLHQSLFFCQSITEVADVLTQGLVESFGAYRARVWLIGPGDLCAECAFADNCPAKESCLHLIASAGHCTNIDGSHRRVPLGAFEIGLIAQGQGKTFSNDVAGDERVHDRQWARAHGLQSFAGFPLLCNGKVIGVMAMFSRSKLQQHLLDMLELLAQVSVAAFEDIEQIEAVRQADRAKSEFLANMSHEIRTPMTAILGFAEMLTENVTDPLCADAIDTIRRNGNHLLEIINGVLDLSKIEAGRLVIEQVDCSPSRVIADVASLMRVRADAKGLSLKVEFDGPIPETIQTDPTRLRQILINLVGNAVKFTESGLIRLTSRLLDANGPKPKLQFNVIDTGIGMNHEQMAQLFQPFTQADASTTRKFGGTGLGLSISKRLAELLGGDVSVSSVSGQGTTFSVTISTGPLADVQMLSNSAEATDASQPVTKASHRSACQLQCRVLLAEDGPDNQRLISFILKKAGAEVTIAENGQVAVDLALSAQSQGSPFAVILMDMQMPVLDGYDATRRLRAEGYSRPIVALTAHAMSGDQSKCKDAGCDGYATKPIDRQALIDLVAAYNCQPSTPAEPTV